MIIKYQRDRAKSIEQNLQDLQIPNEHQVSNIDYDDNYILVEIMEMEDYINARIEQLMEDRRKASGEEDKAWYARLIYELHLVRQYKWKDKYPQPCVLEETGHRI